MTALLRPGWAAALCALATAGALAQTQPPRVDFRTALPGVQWDSRAVVRADFNGDGRLDVALLGDQDGAVVLGIGIRQPGQAGLRVQALRFRVDPDAQDGVCRRPVTLRAARSVCTLENGRLDGCDARRSKAGLRLSDDTCDAIHLYWNFQTDQMAWWRH